MGRGAASSLDKRSFRGLAGDKNGGQRVRKRGCQQGAQSLPSLELWEGASQEQGVCLRLGGAMLLEREGSGGGAAGARHYCPELNTSFVPRGESQPSW